MTCKQPVTHSVQRLSHASERTDLAQATKGAGSVGLRPEREGVRGDYGPRRPRFYSTWRFLNMDRMWVSHSNDHSNAWTDVSTHPTIPNSPGFYQEFPISRILIPQGFWHVPSKSPEMLKLPNVASEPPPALLSPSRSSGKRSPILEECFSLRGALLLRHSWLPCPTVSQSLEGFSNQGLYLRDSSTANQKRTVDSKALGFTNLQQKLRGGDLGSQGSM